MQSEIFNLLVGLYIICVTMSRNLCALKAHQPHLLFLEQHFGLSLQYSIKKHCHYINSSVGHLGHLRTHQVILDFYTNETNICYTFAYTFSWSRNIYQNLFYIKNVLASPFALLIIWCRTNLPDFMYSVSTL